MNSRYFRERVLEKIDKYSAKVGYVIKTIDVHKENSSEYCIDINAQGFLLKYNNFSTVLFSTQDLKKEIEDIDCIDKINVRKIFPFKIKLAVLHKTPVAIWQEGKIFYFITASGEVMEIRSNKNLSKFVLITGSNAPEHTTSLLKFIHGNQDIYSKIGTAVWVGDRRWNIIFNNGTKLMLPEDSPGNAWTRFIRLRQTHADFKNLKYKTVDLRIANKIYVR